MRIAFRGLDVQPGVVGRPADLTQLAFQLAEIELDDGGRRADGQRGDVKCARGRGLAGGRARQDRCARERDEHPPHGDVLLFACRRGGFYQHQQPAPSNR